MLDFLTLADFLVVLGIIAVGVVIGLAIKGAERRRRDDDASR